MKKRVISIGILMMSGIAFSQVGIGTKSPHRSALLELKADAGEYRGVLIPRIPLKDLSDKSNINKGDVAVSLLVFNTTDNAVLTPGFYYWKGKEWVRVIDSKDVIDNIDNFPRNSVLGVKDDKLVLEDTKGGRVETPIKDLNIVTTIKEIEKGKYIYTNELGVTHVIDVAGNVINNITEILKDETVVEEIYQSIAAKGKAATALDGSIKIENGAKAVLNPMQLSVADGGITPSKMAAGSNGSFLITTDTGQVKWVNASDQAIKEILSLNQAITLLEDNKDGTLTYYNESCFDKDGKFIEGSLGQKFDSNTLRIDKTADGKYKFYDGRSKDTPVAVIDVKETVIENITEILENNTVKQEIYNTVAAQGKKVTGDQAISIIGGDKATLAEMNISLKDKGVSSEKIKPGQDKQILITKNGQTQWSSISDELIKEAVKNNERVTVLVNENNGSFTYYNENGVDENGNTIQGKGVHFDANTLRIKEREGKQGKGIYDFYDGMTSLKNPLITINTRANNIVFENNSTVVEGDNLQEVITNIIKQVEVAKGKPATLKGKGIEINGNTELAESVLKEMLLTIANDAITTEKIVDGAVSTYKIKDQAVTLAKITPGNKKNLLVTDKNGNVNWVAATDELIKEVVEQNEVVTLIENNNNGTYSYYNEKAIDKDGKPIKDREILIDANTLTITDNGKGQYLFNDGIKHLATIDIQNTIIENITEILGDTNVQNEIYKTVSNKAQKLDNSDESILVIGGDKAVLTDVKISVANKGISVDKIRPSKEKGQLLVTNAEGQVQWIDANDQIIKEILKSNQAITQLKDNQDGTLVYYNESCYNSKGELVYPENAVKFNSNTLRIDKTADGRYLFYDGRSSTVPVASVDVAATVIENISTILEDTTVQNEVYTIVANKGKSVTSPNSSIKVGAKADMAVLNELELSINKDGVTTETIASKAVTPAKLEAGKVGQLLVTDVNNDVQWVSPTDDIIKEFLKTNQAITELIDHNNGTFTYFNEADYDLDGTKKPNAKGITFDANTLEIKEVLDNGKGTGVYNFYDKTSTTKPIGTVNVAESVINNITSILNNEDVKNQIFTTVSDKGKEVSSSDGSIAVTGGNKAALSPMTLNIQKDGVKTDHITNKAVTSAKINADGASKGAVLTADELGNASFKAIDQAVEPAFKASLKGEDSVVNVDKGSNVLFGKQNVTISINPGGITSSHIQNGTIVNDDISNKTIQAAKLDASGAVKGAVATVGDNGVVSYQVLTSAVITDKGDITSSDGIMFIDNGKDKTLGNVKLGINDKSISANKLTADNATQGAVATVNADGTVSYQVVTSSIITDKASLKTDGIITVDGKNEQSATVLKEATLGIKEKGITATQIADETITNQQIAFNTITVDKISAGTESPSKVMVIDDKGVVKWGELDDIVTDAAGNLTTDGVIEIVTGTGVNSLFNNVEIGIKDKSISNQKIEDQTIQIEKLSNIGAQPGMVMVTNNSGGFTYVDRETIVQAGEDLTLGANSGLEFVVGNGKSAVLASTEIGIKNKGIDTSKLADAVVTTDKMSSTGANKNTVLTADGTGKVEYKKLSEAAFEGAEANLLSDGSLDIPLDNKALLKQIEIGVAKDGIKTDHITNKNVTVEKIGSQGAANASVLTADGNGNATFKTLEEVAIIQGKDLTADTSITVEAGNKALLKETKISLAKDGVKTDHIAAKNVTADKIGHQGASGLVLVTDANGGAEFKSLNTAIENARKDISEGDAITILGGDKAVLKEVTIGVTDGGISEAKLANDAVTKDKIKNKAVTAAKIQGDKARTILVTNAEGEVKWADANENVIKDIVKHNESITILRDNNDGSFTYFNENEVDNKGNVLTNAKGVKFDANTLTITQTPNGVYTFKDKSTKNELAIIDTRASKIIFEGDHIYNNVEEAITNIVDRIEQFEKLDIQKQALTTDGIILVNGGSTEAEAVLKDIKLSIVEEGITTKEIKAGSAKQLLVTNKDGKAQWVDANDDIIKDAIKLNEKITLLQDSGKGSFTYYNEADLNDKGEIIGNGISFDANTLRIESLVPGKYSFYDKSQEEALATIDIQGYIVENITEILKEVNVKEEIFNSVSAHGKKVSTDTAIKVVGGDKAALNEMTISLNDKGVTGVKVADKAITEDKMFAKNAKVGDVPVVQADGSIKYQTLDVVPTGQLLTVDNSLKIEGDASKALLQELDLKVNDSGIANSHIQKQAVTADKIDAADAIKDFVLTATGSNGEATFKSAKDAVSNVMKGDIEGVTGVITVKGGEDTVFGDTNKKVTIDINKGGVKGSHIASETIINNNISKKTIDATRLTAGVGETNRVAVADNNGDVLYKALSTTDLTGKGNISTKDGITVDNGTGKVLSDVTLGIADNSIKVSKFDADGAAAGSVPVVSANGEVVSYQLLNSNLIQGKGNITSDNIVTVKDGQNAVLSDVILGIANKGINTDQLADNAVRNEKISDLSVTANKISAEGAKAKSVLISNDDKTVYWGELGDIVTDTAGNLTTDGIIKMSTDGVNTLLKNIDLSIQTNSITKDKLSSKEAGTTIALDHILVTDGKGGFDYVPKKAFENGGEDLTLGSSLEFTNGSTGLNAMVTKTSFDVATSGISTNKLADQAVTTAKISSEDAKVNDVLTAIGDGKVGYKTLNNTVFEGQGADLKADTSISVVTGNKALLKETSIAVAESGIKAKHIETKAVTTDKISSVNDKSNFAKGTFLTADGNGMTTYQTLDVVASTSGKTVKSTDGSITVTDKNKAVLQDLTINVSEKGIDNKHIKPQAVQAINIGTPTLESGLVLTADGQGGAEFKSVDDALANTAKALTGGDAITIEGSNVSKALLQDAKVSVTDGGIIEQKLANNAVTEIKIKNDAVTTSKIKNGAVTNAKIGAEAVSTSQLKDRAVSPEKLSSNLGGTIGNLPEGLVLTSKGDGSVAFEKPAGATTSGELKGSVTIDVTNGKGALLHDANITIKGNSITESHLVDSAVTESKIANNSINYTQIKDSAIRKNHIYIQNIEEKHLASGAVSERALAGSSVTTGKIANAAVTTDKMSAGSATVGHVLTVEAGGKVAYKAATGQSVTKANLTGTGPIKVSNGTDAVLKAVTLDINQNSIKADHIENGTITESKLATNSVGYKQMRSNAVKDQIIENKGVRVEKLSSLDYDDNQAPQGQVLTSDGNGGVEWKAGGSVNKAAMPKFFYAPSFYITVEAGEKGEVDIYEFYKQQFGSPKAVSSNAQKKSLPVLDYDELDYYVLYYDEEVFKSIEITNEGDLKYEVRNDAQVSTDTYFNIVFGVRE